MPGPQSLHDAQKQEVLRNEDELRASSTEGSHSHMLHRVNKMSEVNVLSFIESGNDRLSQAAAFPDPA